MSNRINPVDRELSEAEIDQAVAIANAIHSEHLIPCVVVDNRTGKRSAAFALVHHTDLETKDKVRTWIVAIMVPPEDTPNYTIIDMDDESSN